MLSDFSVDDFAAEGETDDFAEAGAFEGGLDSSPSGRKDWFDGGGETDVFEPEEDDEEEDEEEVDPAGEDCFLPRDRRRLFFFD